MLIRYSIQKPHGVTDNNNKYRPVRRLSQNKDMIYRRTDKMFTNRARSVGKCLYRLLMSTLCRRRVVFVTICRVLGKDIIIISLTNYNIVLRIS